MIVHSHQLAISEGSKQYFSHCRFSTSEMLKKQPMTQSASVKVFLCVFSVIMCIQSINGHFHHHAPVWKPPKDKAFPICGEDLRDRARCKLPPWCHAGHGYCCRYECVCVGRYNPCLLWRETPSPPKTTTTTAPPCKTQPTTASTPTTRPPRRPPMPPTPAPPFGRKFRVMLN
ncbi:uncharacterized protein [Dermacentor andersoni]|uniref:uncharacterized protein isoform X2 n=1 Tax=Dermacentor andersoni TaxID=34620 RepID=UPI003B3B4491